MNANFLKKAKIQFIKLKHCTNFSKKYLQEDLHFKKRFETWRQRYKSKS